MRALCDTSVLLRAADPTSAHHGPAGTCLARLTVAGHRIVLAPQCIYEFWVVATRPQSVNGLGMAPAQCRIVLDAFLATYDLRPDPVKTGLRWLELVTQHSVSGKQAHDARLVAFMLEHGLTYVVTFNGPRDPASYSNL